MSFVHSFVKRSATAVAILAVTALAVVGLDISGAYAIGGSNTLSGTVTGIPDGSTIDVQIGSGCPSYSGTVTSGAYSITGIANCTGSVTAASTVSGVTYGAFPSPWPGVNLNAMSPTATQNLTFERTSAVTGHVDSATIGSTITIEYQANNFSGQQDVVLTSDGGRPKFELGNLPENVFRFKAHDLSHTTDWTDYYSVSDAETVTDIVMSFADTYTITGTANIPAGEQRSQISVSTTSFGNGYSATWNADGTFSIPGIPAGEYTLTAKTNNGVDFQSVASIGVATTTVSATSNPSVSITLGAPGSISGSISGLPLSTTTANIYTSDSTNSSNYASTTVNVSGGAGTYLLSGLATSTTVSVNVSAGGSYKSKKTSVTSGMTSSGIDFVFASADGGSGGSSPTYSMSGIVSDGLGIASGVDLSLCSSDGCVDATSDSNGAYTLANLATKKVSYVSLDWVSTADTGQTTNYSGSANWWPAVDLSISTMKNITIPRGTGVLRGRVTEQVNGVTRAVKNATISGNISPNGGGYLRFDTRADNNGDYVISGLPLDANFISVSVGKQLGSYNIYKSFDSSYVLTNTNSPRTVDVSLSRVSSEQGYIYGQITDATTNLPVANVQVGLNSQSGSGYRSVTTNSNGEYLIRNVADGSYWMNAYSQSGRYQGTSATVVVTGGSPTNWSRSLTRVATSVGSGVIQGRITEQPANIAAVGVNVHIWKVGGSSAYIEPAVTNSNGDYSFTSLPDGQYYVSTSSNNYSWDEWQFAGTNTVSLTPANRTVTSDFSWSRVPAGNSSVVGIVRDSVTHVPLSDVEVTIERSEGGMAPKVIKTDSKGKFAANSLPAGDYYVYLVADNYLTISADDPYATHGDSSIAAYFSVAASGTETLSLQMRSNPKGSAQIQGAINGPSGPIEGVGVMATLVASNTYIGWFVSDENGHYKVPSLPAGDIKLEVVPYQMNSSLRGLATASIIVSSDGHSTYNKDVNVPRAGTISGKFVDANGKGICNGWAIAYSFDTNGNPTGWGTWAQVDSGTGVYTVSGLAPGDYLVSLAQPYGCQDAGGIQVGDRSYDGTANGTNGLGSHVTVTSSHVTLLNSVTAVPGASISGKVSLSSGVGTTDLSGTKSVNISVFRQMGSSYVRVPYAHGYASASGGGTYTVSGLSDGTYKVLFSDDMPSNRRLKSTFFGGASELASAQTIVVASGEAVSEVDVTLRATIPQVDPDLAPDSSLTSDNEGLISSGAALVPGQDVTIDVGTDFAGEYVAVAMHSTPTLLNGWTLVGADGKVTVTLPAGFEEGNHRIVVQDADNQVIGWAPTTVSSGSGSSIAGTGSSSKRRSNSTSVVASDLSVTSQGSIPSTSKQTKSSGKSATPLVTTSSVEVASAVWILVGGLLIAGVVAGAIVMVRRRRSTR